MSTLRHVVGYTDLPELRRLPKAETAPAALMHAVVAEEGRTRCGLDVVVKDMSQLFEVQALIGKCIPCVEAVMEDLW